MSSVHFRLEQIHAIPAAWDRLERIGWHSLERTGELPDTPLWRGLERLDDLHPHRFAHWHPGMARLLDAARHEHHASTGSSLVTITSAAVPEPASWVLMGVGIFCLCLVGLAVGIWLGRKIR